MAERTPRRRAAGDYRPGQSPVFIEIPQDAGKRRNEMKKTVILLAVAALVALLGACGEDVAANLGEGTEQETAVESEESVESEAETESVEETADAENTEETADAEEETAGAGSEESTAASEKAASAAESTAAAESSTASAAAPTTESGVPAADSEAEVPAVDAEAEAAPENAAPAAAVGAVGNAAVPEAAGNAGGSLLETAKSFEGASLDALIQAIGQPISSDYAPSCLGEGEDGNLYYDGFTVYTYRDGTGEVVSYVE
mgnify:CR=1 FL=1